MLFATLKYLFYTWVFILLVTLFDPLKLEPRSFSYNLPKKFEGALAPNSQLDNAKLLLVDKINGPESLAKFKDAIYTGTTLGQIVKLSPTDQIQHVYKIGEECEIFVEGKDCSRPLGLRFDSKGKLYIADAYKGLLTLDIVSEKVTVLIPHKQLINGIPLIFPDDLDIDEAAGVVYMSDLSTKYPLSGFFYSYVEYECSGRIIEYNIATQKSSVLKDSLCQANGVQLSPQKDFVIVSEFIESRLVKIYTKGAKKGQLEVFSSPMPGHVDNIRITSRGTYWAALACGMNSSANGIMDFIFRYPMNKKLLVTTAFSIGNILEFVNKALVNPSLAQLSFALKTTFIFLELFPSYGLVVELDAQGKILRSLHAPSGTPMFISEVYESPDGYLYIGSFIKNYVGKLKL